MSLITQASVIIGGTPIANIDSIELAPEDVSEGVVLMNNIDFADKTPIPGFTLNVVKSDDLTEPVWKDFNDELAVIQELGGARHEYSGVRLITEGGYTISRDSTKETKSVVFMAKKRTTV